MPDARVIDPAHRRIRGVLGIFGPLALALGVTLIVIGFTSLFSSVGSMQPPRFFWCAFLGIPVLFLGIVLTVPVFLGGVTRYVSAEVAPVHKDTFNYMAEGTSPGVRTLAEAAGQGFASGVASAHTTTCPHCRGANRADARFCDQCGGLIA